MKKIMFIVFGILFGFESNMFGYTWTVKNFTDDANIGVHFCTTTGINNCQDANIAAGTTYTFSFNDWSNKGLLFGSAIVNGQNFDSSTFNVQTDFARTSGGDVRVVKRGGGTYAFEAIKSN